MRATGASSMDAGLGGIGLGASQAQQGPISDRGQSGGISSERWADPPLPKSSMLASVPASRDTANRQQQRDVRLSLDKMSNVYVETKDAYEQHVSALTSLRNEITKFGLAPSKHKPPHAMFEERVAAVDADK